MPGPRYRDGDSITLRTIEEEDIDFCQRLVNDPKTRAMTARTGPTNARQEREWVESVGEDGDAHLLICVDGEPVGIVGHQAPNEAWGTAEVGYMIVPDEWGNGYATDALETLCTDVFSERRLHKLYAVVYDSNPASRRVLEKVGFRQEGYLREEAYSDGKRVDLYRYGLLAEEW